MEDVGKSINNNHTMGIMQRATLYLKRLKKKNFLLFFIMFLLMFLFLGGIAVNSGIQKNIEVIYKGMEGYFTVNSVDPVYRIDDNYIERIMKDGNIIRFNATIELYLSIPNTSLIPGRFSGTGSTEEHMSRFISNTRSKDCEDFLNKNKELIEGEHIEETDTNEAIISDTLASLNNYNIGDTITANIVESSLSLFDNEAEGKTYTFTIKGIYKSNHKQEISADTAECNIEDNYIFIDQYSGKEIASYLQGNKKNAYTGGVQFFLDSPQKANETIKKLSEEAAFENREVNTMNYRYERSEQQLQTMSRLIRIYLWILGFAGMLVLFGIMQIHLRDRRTEIAILMSSGIKKSHLILQHIIENLILYLFSWIVTIILVSALSGVIDRIMTDIHLSLTLPGVCFSGVIGVLIIIIATLSSHIFMLRFSPKQILSKVS